MNMFFTLKSNNDPISEMGHKLGFLMVNPLLEDEYYRAEYTDGENKYVISIVSHDHSKAFSLRQDTYHNYLYCYRGNELVEEHKYMYSAD